MLLANAVALLHAAAVLFMLTGSLLALRWPWVLWLHVPVSLTILGLYLTGSDCPLTTWELALREHAGEPGYTGGFIGHYITEPLGFPIEATSTQVGVVVAALLPNLIGYGLLLDPTVCAAATSPAPSEQSWSPATAGPRVSSTTTAHSTGDAYSNECSGPGKMPPRTSSAYSLAARSSSARRSAYFFTNFGTRPPVNPAMSGQTSTWASQSTPAPMPMVGMASSLVTCPAISAGTISRTTANAPGLLHRVRVVEQLLGARAAALHPEAAEGVLALRREPDVAP